jgi:CRISPR-associated exonuclease Cas4
VWATDAAGSMLAGYADAVAIERDVPVAVLDWKSDVTVTPAQRAHYAGQVRDYMKALGAPKGALVFMTLGTVAWIDA